MNCLCGHQRQPPSEGPLVVRYYDQIKSQDQTVTDLFSFHRNASTFKSFEEKVGTLKVKDQDSVCVTDVPQVCSDQIQPTVLHCMCVVDI